MRRDSERARKLLAEIAPYGVRPNPRRLERWPDDVLPSEGTPPERKAAHIAELDRLTGPRRSLDDNVLLLATRGYGCERYRAILLRSFHLPPPSQSKLVLTVEDPDADLEAIEEFTDELLAETDDGIGDVLRLLQMGNAEASRTDRKNPDLDPPEAVVHSAVTQLTAASLGGDIYDSEPIERALGAQLDEEDVLTARSQAETLYTLVRAMPLDQLVVAAVGTRALLLETAETMAAMGDSYSRHPLVTMSTEDLDKLAAILAPMAAQWTANPETPEARAVLEGYLTVPLPNGSPGGAN